MKLILEVQLTAEEKKLHDAESILAEKLYNTCDDWLNGRTIPELIFVYDDEDCDNLDKEILNCYNPKNYLN